MKYFVINQNGRSQIRNFLQDNMKDFTDSYICEDALDYWCQQAEFQLSEGNGATIELKPWEAWKGYTIEFSISGEGIDECYFDDAEEE